MKDKLVKYNHKKSFYRVGNAVKAFAFASALALGSILPNVIVANASAKEPNAQEAVSSTKTEIDANDDIYEVVLPA